MRTESEIVLLNLGQERFVTDAERLSGDGLIVVVSSQGLFDLLPLHQSHRAVRRLAQAAGGVKAERFYIP